MFTGLIDNFGILTQIEKISGGLRLAVTHTFPNLAQGESVAVDGCCLTVISFSDCLFNCDVSPETLNLTTLNQLKIGQIVNLERALQVHSRMGGHFVTGHVDQTALVKSINQKGEFIEMVFTGFSVSQNMLIQKGSIAINGVSLTINKVNQGEVSVMLIPLTLQKTNLKNLREKDLVNVEFDLLARMVAKQIENLTL